MPSTTSTATAASGRYIRCSAIVSVATGTTLELAARTAKKLAPRNPMAGRRPPDKRPRDRRHHRHDEQGVREDTKGRAHEGAAVVEDQRVRPEAEPQIMGDRLRLRQSVAPPGDSTAGSSSSTPAVRG